MSGYFELMGQVFGQTWWFAAAWLVLAILVPVRAAPTSAVWTRMIAAVAANALAYAFIGWLVLYPALGHMSAWAACMSLVLYAWPITVVRGVRVALAAKRSDRGSRTGP